MEYDASVLIQRTDDANQGTEAAGKLLMTLHCAQCNRVLGDSLGVCGEMKWMDAIMCLRVTSDVIVSDTVESGHKGGLANCIYSSLQCHGCHCAVGRIIHSAPSHLATVRSIFLLYKANINCYILNSSSMVKASTLTFDLKPLRDSINEVRQQFEENLDQMFRIKSRLAEECVISKKAERT